MKDQRKNPELPQKDTDVSRSQHQQTQQAANDPEAENRAEGAKYKGNPKHQHGSHQEGQYTPQSDDPTMNPSGIEEQES